MKPNRQVTERKATDYDKGLMSVMDNAFSMSKRIKANLKSLNDDITPLVSELVDEDKAFSSLEDLFEDLGKSNITSRRNRYGGYYSNPAEVVGNIKTFLAAVPPVSLLWI